jgi:hypothetical protein
MGTGMLNFRGHTPLAPKLFLDPNTREPVNPRSS